MKYDLTNFTDLTDTRNVPFISVKSNGRLKFNIGVTTLIGERNRIEKFLIHEGVIVFVLGETTDPSSDSRDTLRTRGSRSGEKSCRPKLIRGGILPLEIDPETGEEYTERKMIVGDGLIMDRNPTEEKYGKVEGVNLSDFMLVLIDTNKGELNTNRSVKKGE